MLSCGAGEGKGENGAKRMLADGMVNPTTGSSGSDAALQRSPISSAEWALIDALERENVPVGPIVRIDRISVEKGVYEGYFFFAQWSHAATQMW